MRAILFNKKNVKLLTETCGVYTFYDRAKKPIYIGKAINLKRRVSSYLVGNLLTKTARMVNEAKYFCIIKVNSNLEALLLEAKLVRKHKPKYNSQLKDGKRPLYIVITKESYPRATTARKIDKVKGGVFFGPFPDSTTVKTVLGFLRKIFPWADHKTQKRPCFLSQIGLCSPCPSYIENLSDKDKKRRLKAEYVKNLRNVRKVLSGKIKTVQRELISEMKKYSDSEQFEKASKIKFKLEKLEYITQSITPVSAYLKNPNLVKDIRNRELQDLAELLSGYLGGENVNQKLKRIECFDVAHLSGTQATASMITFIEGEPEKSLYRHFRINQKRARSDYDSLVEVAKRRVKNLPKWGVPELIVVDGGKPQVSAFLNVFDSKKIPIIGLAKRKESLIIPLYTKSQTNFTNLSDNKSQDRAGQARRVVNYKVIVLPTSPALNLLQRLRNEAHRFARRYHHKLVARELIPS